MLTVEQIQRYRASVDRRLPEAWGMEKRRLQFDIDLCDMALQALAPPLSAERAELVGKLRHPGNVFLFDSPVAEIGMALLGEAADAIERSGAEQTFTDLLNYGQSWSKDGVRIDPRDIAQNKPSPERVREIAATTLASISGSPGVFSSTDKIDIIAEAINQALSEGPRWLQNERRDALICKYTNILDGAIERDDWDVPIPEILSHLLAEAIEAAPGENT